MALFDILYCFEKGFWIQNSRDFDVTRIFSVYIPLTRLTENYLRPLILIKIMNLVIMGFISSVRRNFLTYFRSFLNHFYAKLTYFASLCSNLLILITITDTVSFQCIHSSSCRDVSLLMQTNAKSDSSLFAISTCHRYLSSSKYYCKNDSNHRQKNP